jgi:DNA (cytosine-5)-methyltransferase 1
MYANGTLSPLPTSELRTDEKGSGLWPTPTVFHALRGNHDEPIEVYIRRVKDHREGKTKGKPGPSLGIAVRIREGAAPWIKCPCCEDYFCTIHFDHVHDCRCPPIEEWEQSPYKPRIMWPTPTARDWKGPCWNTPARDCLDHAVERGETKKKKYPKPPPDGGRLNPNWVEWLMGYPTEWTDLGASETP